MKKTKGKTIALEVHTKEIQELKDQLEACQSDKLRALADLHNFQRRESENKIHWSRDAVCLFLEKISPRLHELSISQAHTSDKDVQKALENFFKTLEKTGVQKINPPKDTPVDPEIHEVLMTGPGKKGCVVQVLEPGWSFQEKVITPAKISAAEE